MGEIVWTTDGQQLWVGDGLTQGGSPVVGPNVVGYGLAYDATTRRIEVAGLSADDITNGVNNKFFATELAQDAAASLFVNGTHANISFVYDDALGKINATVALDGIGLTDIVADTTPQLGGNLDLNSFDITGIGDIDITGDINIIGGITLNGVLSNGDVNIENAVITAIAGTGFDGGPGITLGEPTADIAHTFIFNQVDGNPAILVKTVADTTENTAKIKFEGFGGSFSAPTRLGAGDVIGGFSFSTYEPSGGGATLPSLLIVGKTDPNGTVNATVANGKLEILVAGGASTLAVNYLTFDSKGQLAVNQEDAQATLDVNGFAKLAVLTAEPAVLANGMIAIADGTLWNPLTNGRQCMVVRLNGAWIEIASANP
jgi:hypothetical protein